MNKLVIKLLLLIGVCCLLFSGSLDKYGVYIQVLGICLTMFSIYSISASLTSVKKSEKNNNLKL